MARLYWRSTFQFEHHHHSFESNEGLALEYREISPSIQHGRRFCKYPGGSDYNLRIFLAQEALLYDLKAERFLRHILVVVVPTFRDVKHGQSTNDGELPTVNSLRRHKDRFHRLRLAMEFDLSSG